MARLPLFALFLVAPTDAFHLAPCRSRLSDTAMKAFLKDGDASTNGIARRDFLAAVASAGFLGIGQVALQPALAAPGAENLYDSMDVDSFIRTGMVAQPMGVSGQAGKSRPETGVVMRDGSEVNRDSRSGGVLAEILLEKAGEPLAVLATFESPWPLAKGTVFGVECRDSKTGDGAFLAVTSSTGGKAISDLPDSFFLERLFSPTGRFSFYGTPTDIKVRSSKTQGSYRYIELGFSNLSQSTQTEIPRSAILAATVPEGADEAVMLIGSASASRWRKGSEGTVRKVVESFRALPAPTSGMKIRAKERTNTNS